MGQTIPFACQAWASTKAAYRFLSDDRVSEHDILSGHFNASAARFAAATGPILVLQDTTTFSYQREHPRARGLYRHQHYARPVQPDERADTMRNPDAFESGGYRRRFATGSGCGECSGQVISDRQIGSFTVGFAS